MTPAATTQPHSEKKKMGGAMEKTDRGLTRPPKARNRRTVRAFGRCSNPLWLFLTGLNTTPFLLLLLSVQSHVSGGPLGTERRVGTCVGCTRAHIHTN